MQRILIIDDDPTVTSVLKRGLAYEGFTVDTAGTGAQGLSLVAPDGRESDVRDQPRCPAVSQVADVRVRFLPYSALAAHRGTTARFGHGMKAVEAVARTLT